MKINCGLTRDEKIQRLKREIEGKWLPYYAWLPIRVDENDCRWLEYVERKVGYVGAYGTFIDIEYRAMSNYRPD